MQKNQNDLSGPNEYCICKLILYKHKSVSITKDQLQTPTKVVKGKVLN